jgi:hypothetical protein
MSSLTPEEKSAHIKSLINEGETLEEKKALFKQHVTSKMMNPVDNFDPETFDPMADETEEYQLAKRQRILPPKELPTFGMKPKEIMEGQCIGLYESKQDIYLILAHRCNDLQRQVDELKKLIEGKPLKS